MSYIPEKAARALRRAMARLDNTVSAEAAKRKRRAPKLVGSDAIVVVRLSSANETLSNWQHRKKIAADEKHAAGRYKDQRHRDTWAVRETAIGECIVDLRRLLESETERQPQHNIAGQPRRSEA